MIKKDNVCTHDPDIMVTSTGAYKTTKCLKCKQHIISIADSKWMTNSEYRTYITQEHHGVNNEI